MLILKLSVHPFQDWVRPYTVFGIRWAVVFPDVRIAVSQYFASMSPSHLLELANETVCNWAREKLSGTWTDVMEVLAITDVVRMLLLMLLAVVALLAPPSRPRM